MRTFTIEQTPFDEEVEMFPKNTLTRELERRYKISKRKVTKQLNELNSIKINEFTFFL